MKKIFAIIIISIMLFGLAGFAFAQGRELEIEYPEVEGEQSAPEEVTTPVTEYFKYIFNFLIWVSGIIALVVLIQAGLKYFMSAGNPEAINDAKSKISAALLGILILFGSYLILITINPDLIVFRLERLRPIMPELPIGVLACKKWVATDSGDDAILMAWELTVEYKLTTPTIEREREIKKQLDEILDKIALECYSISGTTDIRSDFDNKIQYIYFIPMLEVKEIKVENPTGGFITQKQITTTEYGAIVYEERNLEGKSQLLARNLTDPQGSADAYQEPVLIKASSIKPFALIYKPDPNWQVVLYQEYNQNKGIEGLTPVYANITTNPGCITSRNQEESSEWWCGFNLAWPPKSMWIDGDLLVILCKDKIELGSCQVFFSEIENNLEEYENIVEWVDCKNYQSGNKKEVWVSGGFGGYYKYECAQAAATTMMIISAKPY